MRKTNSKQPKKTKILLRTATRKVKPLVEKQKKKIPKKTKAVTGKDKPNRNDRGYLISGGASLNPTGRPKGTKNKFTSLKKAFLDAFEKLGGVSGLVYWAQFSSANMRVFYQMTARMLPREISLGDLDIKPNDLSSFRDEELDAIIAKNLKRK